MYANVRDALSARLSNLKLHRWRGFPGTNIFGFTERIHSDQVANSERQLIGELLRVSGVKKSHTTSYHPMRNGSVERFNRTWGGRVITPDAKADWP